MRQDDVLEPRSGRRLPRGPRIQVLGRFPRCRITALEQREIHAATKFDERITNPAIAAERERPFATSNSKPESPCDMQHFAGFDRKRTTCMHVSISHLDDLAMASYRLSIKCFDASDVGAMSDGAKQRKRPTQ